MTHPHLQPMDFIAIAIAKASSTFISHTHMLELNISGTNTNITAGCLEKEVMRRSIISCQEQLIEYENNILRIAVRLSCVPGVNC